MNSSKLENRKRRAHELIRAGNWDEAKRTLVMLSKKFPRDFDVWYWLGGVFGQSNNLAQAAECCKKALHLNPSHPGALFNYGMALTQLGNITEAEKVYLRALKLNPHNPATLYNLGNIYKDLYDYEKAVDYLNQCLKQDPSKANALFSLGSVYVELDHKDQAIDCLQRSMKIDADLKSKCEYFIGYLSKDKNISEKGLLHVQKLHDNHAEIFDEHLTRGLEYNIPKQLFVEYSKLAFNMDGEPRILDLGCGTGLCGIEFKNVTQDIVGVDLSEKMLEKARDSGVYKKLILQDLLSYLQKNDQAFDVILSADVFIYVGALDEVLPLCADTLEPGGVMLFSVESIPGKDFKLRVSGRFAHSSEYIKEQAEDAGLNLLSAHPVSIRKELGKDIEGAIYILQKK